MIDREPQDVSEDEADETVAAWLCIGGWVFLVATVVWAFVLLMIS